MADNPTSIHLLAPSRRPHATGIIRVVLKRISLPLNSHATTANALSPAVDARVLGSAAMYAPSVGSDHSGATIF